MEIYYPIIIAFLLVFISELGDKTQLLVLSFSSKLKPYSILIGVAIGSFLSHGIAILFGSMLGSLENSYINEILKFITYISFIIFGIITLNPNKKEKANEKKENKSGILKIIEKIGLGYIIIIAMSIAIGELGDKTFLASIGLGIQYPNSKVYLIIGAVLGMVISDSLAIIFGKMLSKKISDKAMETLSGVIFLLFGFLGLINYLIK